MRLRSLTAAAAASVIMTLGLVVVNATPASASVTCQEHGDLAGHYREVYCSSGLFDASFNYSISGWCKQDPYGTWPELGQLFNSFWNRGWSLIDCGDGFITSYSVDRIPS